jgi:hypothetical protein
VAGANALRWSGLAAFVARAAQAWQLKCVSIHTDSTAVAGELDIALLSSCCSVEVVASAIALVAGLRPTTEPDVPNSAQLSGLHALLHARIPVWLELPIGWPSMHALSEVTSRLAGGCRGISGIILRKGKLDFDAPTLQSALQRRPTLLSDAIGGVFDTLLARGIRVVLDPSEGFPFCMFPHRLHDNFPFREGYPNRQGTLTKTPECGNCVVKDLCPGMAAEFEGRLRDVPRAIASTPVRVLALGMDSSSATDYGVWQGSQAQRERFRTFRSYLDRTQDGQSASAESVIVHGRDYATLGVRLDGFRVALVVPAGRVDENYDDKNRQLPPLSLIHLASFLRQHGCNVVVRHLLLDPAIPEQAHQSLSERGRLAQALAHQPDAGIDAALCASVDRIGIETVDLIGISSNNEHDTATAVLMTREIRRRGCSVPVVLGGNFNLPILTEALRREIDYFVQGDGEVPLALLCHALSHATAVDWIPGLSSSHPAQRPFGNRRIFHSLDMAPAPDLNGFDLDRYAYELFTGWPGPTAPYQFISGCLYNCAFCSGATKRRYRRRSPPLVVRDLLHIHRHHGISQFFFVNNMFNVEEAYCHQLLDGLIDTGVAWHWTDSGRPAGLSAELLRKMRLSGCEFMTWGVDSTSDRLSRIHRKNLKQSEVLEVLKAASQAGIRNHINVLPGLPGEREDDLQQMVQFLRQARPFLYQVTLSPYQFIEHSDLGVHPERYGVVRRADILGVDEPGAMTWEQRTAWIARAHGILREEVEAIHSQR